MQTGKMKEEVKDILCIPVFFLPALASFSAFSFSFAVAVMEDATSFASAAFKEVIDSLIIALSRAI